MISQEIKPSEPAFRWFVVFAGALLLAIAMGTLVNGFSAFLVPLETHFGWSRAETAAINSVGLIGIGLGGILMGFLADRMQTRTVCLIGAFAISFCLLISAHAQSLWQFYTFFSARGHLAAVHFSHLSSHWSAVGFRQG